MTDAPPDVPLVMRSRLGELDGCWLEVRCRCGRSVSTPIKLLLGSYGPAPYIGSILPRLKCRQCGARPATASLNQTPNSLTNYGAAPGWTIPLLP